MIFKLLEGQDPPLFPVNTGLDGLYPLNLLYQQGFLYVALVSTSKYGLFLNRL